MATDRLYAERDAITQLSDNFDARRDQAEAALARVRSGVSEASSTWEGNHKTALQETYEEANVVMAMLATDCGKLCSSIRAALDVIIAEEERVTAEMAR